MTRIFSIQPCFPKFEIEDTHEHNFLMWPDSERNVHGWSFFPILQFILGCRKNVKDLKKYRILMIVCWIVFYEHFLILNIINNSIDFSTFLSPAPYVNSLSFGAHKIFNFLFEPPFRVLIYRILTITLNNIIVAVIFRQAHHSPSTKVLIYWLLRQYCYYSLSLFMYSYRALFDKRTLMIMFVSFAEHFNT